MDNIKRKLNKCRFHSLFIKYSIRKCRKSQLENKIILFALWKVFQNFNDRALLELCKIALYDVSSSDFCSTTHVWAKFWQPSNCLSGPPILSGKRRNKTFPAWTKGCKDTIDTVATTFSKTWHRVLRTLSLFCVSFRKYRILDVERNRNLKIHEDTITQPAPEVTLKFKEQENSTAQQVCKC